MLPPNASRMNDKICWGHESNGAFTVKSAYQCRMHNYPKVPIFRSIWKLNVPERVRIFVWKLAHERLLTREIGNRWWDGVAHCPVCLNAVESATHALRDCPVVSVIWNAFVSLVKRVEFFSLQYKE